jgi:hypothetical protein
MVRPKRLSGQICDHIRSIVQTLWRNR